MTGARIGRLPGYRPSGSSRNGMPDFAGYRFKGTEDWYPEAGRHLDAEAVAPAPMAAARPWPGGRVARMAAYSQARRDGLSKAQAAERVEIAPETAVKYERAYRRGEAS